MGLNATEFVVYAAQTSEERLRFVGQRQRLCRTDRERMQNTFGNDYARAADGDGWSLYELSIWRRWLAAKRAARQQCMG